ncbi:MAG: hypothetical protein R3325_15475, partial [Thermoanaerobaculia bacterium]|nr:hypothetical protein [Thermoanaerobaculia bacterium]
MSRAEVSALAARLVPRPRRIEGGPAPWVLTGRPTLELEPPADFEAMLAAAAAIYRSEALSARTGLTTTLISGLVV